MSPNFLSQLVGCFATPVAENPTVVMMEAVFHHHNLDWRYMNCEVTPENLGAAVRGAWAMGWAGFHCSLPHKVTVIEYLDGLGKSAEVIGAVNTVVRRGDKFIGENTDGKGFVQALQTIIDSAGKSIVIFGAGGAARAVSVELALAGASRIKIVNRSRDRGQVLVDLLNARTPAKADLVEWSSTFSIPEDVQIVINATSIGLFPDNEGRLDVDMASFRADLVVADGIHNPPRTILIREAEERGCKVLDGLGMLVNQGVISVKYWSGENVDASVMRSAVEQALSCPDGSAYARLHLN